MENYIEIIEKFIDDELEGEQLEWFQNQLRTNREFVKQYQLQIDINEAVKEDDIMQLRNKLESIYNEYNKNENKVIRHNFLRKLSVAASIIIVAGIATILMLTNKKYTHQELFATYYQPYENISNYRGGEPTDDIFTEAFRLYDCKLYKEALEKFNLILDKEPGNTFILFYTAVTEIETGKTESAVNKFKVILKDKNDLFYQQSEWYLGLCYLKMNKKSQAIKIFNEIINNNHHYKPDAEEILSKL